MSCFLAWSSSNDEFFKSLVPGWLLRFLLRRLFYHSVESSITLSLPPITHGVRSFLPSLLTSFIMMIFYSWYFMVVVASFVFFCFQFACDRLLKTVRISFVFVVIVLVLAMVVVMAMTCALFTCFSVLNAWTNGTYSHSHSFAPTLFCCNEIFYILNGRESVTKPISMRRPSVKRDREK